MKITPVFVVIILFFSVFTVWGQAYDQPSVTDIKLEARNNLIRLTWTDSSEARGPVYIFRSTRPFTGSIPANIRPVIVRYGTQYYIDDIDDLENLYYFIAASDTAGRRFDHIIPRINYTSIIQVQPEEEPASMPSVIAQQEIYEYIDEHIEGISNLRVVLDHDKVIISFNNSYPERNTIIYRSNSLVRNPQSLLNAAIVQSARSGRLTSTLAEDYPLSGYSWYYTVIYEDEIALGNINIIPGVNTTINPVIIPEDISQGRVMRPMPLPILTVNDTSVGFLTNPSGQIPLSPESIGMLSGLPKIPSDNLNLKRPRVFIIDTQSPAGGEESMLFQIIKESFISFDWDNSRARLSHFLSLPRSKEVEARARFYLGQALYFTGNYKDALMEFLAFRSYHRVEANIWIDATLEALINY